jgi:hypothetical protein
MSEIQLREDTHYTADDFKNEYACLSCGRTSPYRYSSMGTHGTPQLMRIYAWHNFRRHLQACWSKSSDHHQSEGEG